MVLWQMRTFANMKRYFNSNQVLTIVTQIAALSPTHSNLIKTTKCITNFHDFPH